MSQCLHISLSTCNNRNAKGEIPFFTQTWQKSVFSTESSFPWTFSDLNVSFLYIVLNRIYIWDMVMWLLWCWCREKCFNDVGWQKKKQLKPGIWLSFFFLEQNLYLKCFSSLLEVMSGCKNMTCFVFISQDNAGKQYKCAHAWHFRGDTVFSL